MNIINFRMDDQGAVAIDWVDQRANHPDFDEVHATHISPKTQAKYDYIEKLLASVFSDLTEILDYVHGVKSGNIRID